MIPRLAWPLTVAADGRLSAVAQDSDEDITQCLKAIIATRVGDRPDVPEMGVPDLEFGEQPLEVDAVREVLARHEPRVAALISSSPDALDELIADVTVEWERQPNADTDPES